MDPAAFSDLVAAAHQFGVKRALSLFPEAADQKPALTRLTLAQVMAEEKEAELLRAQAHVGSIEAELRAALVQEEA